MLSSSIHIKIALSYFVIASFLGIFLRLFAIIDFDATHKFIVHTHSHIALLGWVYVALSSLLVQIGIQKKYMHKYIPIFWCTQVTIIGMLLTFPFIGYAVYSIIFSTLFIICTYWFFVFYRKYHTMKTTSISFKFINLALIFMVISSIGPWALGIIMNTLGSTSHWYTNAIYFYLHFQYNGWFIFSLLGIFFYILEYNTISYSVRSAKKVYVLMMWSCIGTLFLSFLWMDPHKSIQLIAWLGAIVQLVAVGFLFTIMYLVKDQLKNALNVNGFALLKFTFLLFIVKVIAQFISAFPNIAILINKNIDLVIGYLHLVFLGVVSISIILFLTFFKILIISRVGLFIYLMGFILSEFVIFYKGFAIWNQGSIPDKYYEILVCFSALMPIGILLIYIKNFTSQRPN